MGREVNDSKVTHEYVLPVLAINHPFFAAAHTRQNRCAQRGSLLNLAARRVKTDRPGRAK